MKEKKLYRSCKNKYLGGVCGGLGEYFDIDPILIRLALILLAFAGGAGIVCFVVAWLIIPLYPACESKATAQEEIKDKAEQVAKEVKKAIKENQGHDGGRSTFGMIIILLGILFLVQNIFNINLWHSFWPFLLIVFGISVVLNNVKK